MTPADLAQKSAALEALRRQWEPPLLAMVARKVADARAHAGHAVTERLRQARDGRPTLRLAGRHPSYRAAVSRLEELATWLVGPAQWSLAGKLRDHREAAYRLAHQHHARLVPSDLHVTADPAPTLRNLELVRGAALHGHDLRQEVGPVIEAQVRKLAAAVAIAGSGTADDRLASQGLDLWERRAAAAIAQVVVTVLSDSTEHADTEAGRDVIHPSFLEA